jgi:hypothetical protein
LGGYFRFPAIASRPEKAERQFRFPEILAAVAKPAGHLEDLERPTLAPKWQGLGLAKQRVMGSREEWYCRFRWCLRAVRWMMRRFLNQGGFGGRFASVRVGGFEAGQVRDPVTRK